jgi:hypothetical protein
MKFTSWPLLLLVPVALSGCSNSSGNGISAVESVKYGSRAPVGNLPELTSSYRPRKLSAKVFTTLGITYAPMDFQTQNLTLTFDAQAQTVTGHSTILFREVAAGRPYLHLLAQVATAKINGMPVTASDVDDPDGLGNTYVSFDQDLDADKDYVLELDYTLPAGRVSFANGGVGFLTDMTDLLPGEFFERWGPSNFEQDAFSLTVNLKIVGSQAQHQLFTNGVGTQVAAFEWVASFPAHFTSSSFFLHLTNRMLSVKHFAIPGLEKSIPVTVYANDPALVEKASAMLPSLFQELESDYGPYAHSQFVAYINASGGGMEYVGATITSTGALDHELFHSWFARGVMPAEGRSGWIDEAMASWRDYGYFQATTLLSRNPTTLSAYSPFRRSTPSNCYKDGRAMLGELDLVLHDFGGLKPFMRLFFNRYKYRVVTTEEFWNFLELQSGMSLAPYFQRYIFGNAPTTLSIPPALPSPAPSETLEKFESLETKHPSPLTQEELRNLR